MRIASRARIASARGPPSGRAVSAIVGIGSFQGGAYLVLSRAEPAHLDAGEGALLAELDEPLLVELEHGEKADDDIEARRRVQGELAERRGAEPRQLAREIVEGVAHAGADRRNVVHVDPWQRPRRGRTDERLAHLLGGDA